MSAWLVIETGWHLICYGRSIGFGKLFHRRAIGAERGRTVAARSMKQRPCAGLDPIRRAAPLLKGWVL